MKNLNQENSTSQSCTQGLNLPTSDIRIAGIRIRSNIRAGEIGRPLTPISFAGANRRARRRDRRDDRH
jgi:hypothetical protein